MAEENPPVVQYPDQPEPVVPAPLQEPETPEAIQPEVELQAGEFEVIYSFFDIRIVRFALCCFQAVPGISQIVWVRVHS
jgi:hypothetical protein